MLNQTNNYVLVDEARVLDFLDAHQGLDKLLLEAYEHIHAYFPDSQNRLEVITDPELGYQQLLVTIITPSNVDEAMDRLDLFRNDWWLDNLWRANEKLLIDVGVE
jgi:hypothetical protein